MQTLSGSPMTDIHIHQICYSRETFNSCEPDFEPLDNLDNPRPDWREYWPIRQFLRSTHLQEDACYGFFSPKFGAKTGLDAAQVLEFVAKHAADSDVILFSPFYDQMAYPLNVFEQGALQHAHTLATFRECVQLVSPDVDFDRLVMDSTNTVFCNYFVAKPAFWRAWLAKCEQLFAIAEAGSTDLAGRLNAATNHDGGGVPTKVFVIERLASLMLATERRWTACAFNPMGLPWSQSPLSRFRLEMAFLDSLKIAYATEGRPQYLKAFHELRQILNESLQPQPQ